MAMPMPNYTDSQMADAVRRAAGYFEGTSRGSILLAAERRLRGLGEQAATRYEGDGHEPFEDDMK